MGKIGRIFEEKNGILGVLKQKVHRKLSITFKGEKKEKKVEERFFHVKHKFRPMTLFKRILKQKMKKMSILLRGYFT